MDNELCGNCGRAIGKMEKPCVFDGNVVCFECDQRLRRQANTITPAAPVLASPVATAGDTKPKSSNIWAGLCIVLSVIAILIAGTHLESTSHPRYEGVVEAVGLEEVHALNYMSTILLCQTIAITFALIGLALKTKDGEK